MLEKLAKLKNNLNNLNLKKEALEVEELGREIPHIYVVNLDRSPDRYENMKAQLDAQNLKYSRFKAVDGSLMSEEERDSFKTEKGKKEKSLYLRLTAGGVGIAATHKNLYNMCKNFNNDIIILEDDAVLAPDFENKIKDLYKKIDKYDWDICYLGRHPGHNKEDDTILEEGVSQCNSAVCGLFGLILRPSGAKIMLKELFPLDYQIDTEMNLLMQDGSLTGLYVDPQIVTSDVSSPQNSLIQFEDSDLLTQYNWSLVYNPSQLNRPL